jgi:hypothetical protein
MSAGSAGPVKRHATSKHVLSPSVAGGDSGHYTNAGQSIQDEDDVKKRRKLKVEFEQEVADFTRRPVFPMCLTVLILMVIIGFAFILLLIYIIIPGTLQYRTSFFRIDWVYSASAGGWITSTGTPTCRNLFIWDVIFLAVWFLLSTLLMVRYAWYTANKTTSSKFYITTVKYGLDPIFRVYWALIFIAVYFHLAVIIGISDVFGLVLYSILAGPSFVLIFSLVEYTTVGHVIDQALGETKLASMWLYLVAFFVLVLVINLGIPLVVWFVYLLDEASQVPWVITWSVVAYLIEIVILCLFLTAKPLLMKFWRMKVASFAIPYVPEIILLAVLSFFILVQFFLSFAAGIAQNYLGVLQCSTP